MATTAAKSTVYTVTSVVISAVNTVTTTCAGYLVHPLGIVRQKVRSEDQIM